MDNHGVVGALFWFKIWMVIRLLILVRWSQENSQALGDGDGFLKESLDRCVETDKYLKVW